MQIRLLFLGLRGSCRCRMAGAFARRRAAPGINVAFAMVEPGASDPLADEVMAEIGLDISRHKPVTFEEIDEWEGLNFDLIITLAPEAHHRALELTRTSGVDVEYWPTADPSGVEGSREQRLDAYREVRDQLLARIRQRFSRPTPGNE